MHDYESVQRFLYVQHLYRRACEEKVEDKNTAGWVRSEAE